MNFTGPLEDRIAIRELCDHYAGSTMSADWKTWGEAWAEDAEWVASDGTTTKGRAAIVERCIKITSAFLGAGGFFANPGSVHVEGNRATGRCHHLELFFFPDGPKWFLTYYDDVYTKTGGRWYFQKRTLTVVKTGTFGASQMPK